MKEFILRLFGLERLVVGLVPWYREASPTGPAMIQKVASAIALGLLATSCSSAPPKPDPAAKTRVDPLMAFAQTFERPETDGFVVLTHRVDIDGQAPLELVLEERCRFDTCEFEDPEGNSDEERSSWAPPRTTQFRVFDVSNPDDPRPLHAEPIRASHFATLHTFEADGQAPREVYLRQASYRWGYHEHEDFFTSQTYTLTDGRWTKTPVPECASAGMHLGYRQLTLPVDIDPDPVSEWITVEATLEQSAQDAEFQRMNLERPFSITRYCDEDAGVFTSEFEERFSRPELMTQLSEVLAQNNAEPGRLAALLAVLQLLNWSPEEEKLPSLRAILMRRYEDLRGEMGSLSLTDFATDRRDLRPTILENCGDQPPRECIEKTAALAAFHHVPGDAMRQVMALRGLAWLGDGQVQAWSTGLLSEANSLEEVSALTQLSLSLEPEDSRTAWAEAQAARLLGDLLIDGEVRATRDPLEPLTTTDRALAGLNALMQTEVGEYSRRGRPGPEDVAWDIDATFEDFVAKALENPTRLAALMAHSTIWFGAARHLLDIDWESASIELAEAFFVPGRLSYLLTPDNEAQVKSVVVGELERARSVEIASTFASCDPASTGVFFRCADAMQTYRTVIERVGATEAGLTDGFALQLGFNWSKLDVESRRWWIAQMREVDRGEQELLNQLTGRPTFGLRPDPEKIRAWLSSRVDIAGEFPASAQVRLLSAVLGDARQLVDLQGSGDIYTPPVLEMVTARIVALLKEQTLDDEASAKVMGAASDLPELDSELVAVLQVVANSDSAAPSQRRAALSALARHGDSQAKRSLEKMLEK